MKKLNLFLVLALLLGVMTVGSAAPAFAFHCKAGNQQGPDECWTDVYLTTEGDAGSDVQVSAGTIVVVSAGFSTVASNDGSTVRRTTSSLDTGTIGVIQQTIASADIPGWARVQVRGRGQVKIQGTADDAIAAADVLVVKTSTGYQGVATENVAATDVRNGVATKIGKALEADTDAVDELIWTDICVGC